MSNKIYNLIFLLVVVFILPNSVLAATPTITNVDGTISNGQTVTVTGTNMVNENTAHWVPELKNIPAMYGFEHNSDLQLPWGEVVDGYRLANNAAPMAEPPGAIDNDCAFTSAVKLSGARSMKCHVAGGGGAGYPPNDGGSAITFYTSEDSAWYFRFYTRWNAVDNKWADNYMKLTFTMPANPMYNQWYIDLAGESDGSPNAWYLKWSGTESSYPAIPGGLKADRWYLVEGEWTSSPRAMKIWVDGIQIWDGVPDAALHNAYPQLGIINFRSVNYFIDITNWTDNWAFSYTNRIYPSSIIEISGDGITWKYQEPVFLSDTSSQIKVNLSGLTGTNYQMRVTNNRQETSQIYSLSEGGDDAAPSVSGVSGVLSHNSSVVVTGNGFGIKSISAPQLWDTVENQYSGLSNGQTIPVGEAYPWDQNCATEDTNCTKYNTTSGEQRGLSTAGYKSINTNYGFMGGHTIISTNKIYISWWWKPDTDPTENPTLDGHSGKFVRLSSSIDTENKTFSWTQMHNYVYSDEMYCQGGVANWASWNGNVNGWNFHEVWIDGSNRTYTIRINGDDTQASAQSWNSCSQFNFDFVKLVGWDSDSITVPLSLTSWMDDIYVDNTFSRVMIGNASTYSASNHFEMQIPTTWSDGAISFNVNQGSFANNAGAYLYVLDSAGSVNTNGFPITFGTSGGNITTPTAPTGLGVL